MEILLVNVPGLVCTIVASPPDDVHVVSVTVSVDIKAVSSWVSEVSESSWVERDLLVTLVSPWSDDHVLVESELFVDVT